MRRADLSVSRSTGFRWWFLILQLSMRCEDFSVSRRTGFRWWFLGLQDSMCGEDLSAATEFSSMNFDSARFYVRWRFRRQPWNSVLVMISGSRATQFSSLISDYIESICAEDFSVTRGTGFRWWFLGLQRPSFRQWFLILQQSMLSEDFRVSRRIRFWWWFLGLQRRSFRQWFWFCSSLCAFKFSASTAELDSSDDFRVCSDSVFVNDFWLRCTLCALKISTSPVEPGSGDDF
jgi:hypothetical protein